MGQCCVFRVPHGTSSQPVMSELPSSAVPAHECQSPKSVEVDLQEVAGMPFTFAFGLLCEFAFLIPFPPPGPDTALDQADAGNKAE